MHSHPRDGTMPAWEYEAAIPHGIKVKGAGAYPGCGIGIDQPTESNINGIIINKVCEFPRDRWETDHRYTFRGISRAGLLSYKKTSGSFKEGTSDDYLLNSVAVRVKRYTCRIGSMAHNNWLSHNGSDRL